jgi:hypothetical protein
MALKKCSDCGNPISKRAETCPHCGAPNTTAVNIFGCLVIFFVLGVGFMIAKTMFGFMFSSGETVPPQPPVEIEAAPLPAEAPPAAE